MKRWTRIIALMLSLCLFSFTALTVAASELPDENQGSSSDTNLAGNLDIKEKDPYEAYTIRIFSGNQGRFKDGSTVKTIEIDPRQTEGEDNVARINLPDYKKDVDVLDGSKYYVKGIRQSGRDNSTIDTSSFVVDRDMDFVVAYGLKGRMVRYRVEFVDENGRTLADTQYFEGKEGEKQIVSYLYIDGYRPQAYNLAKTLTDDVSKNVFRFIYTPGTVPAGVITGEGGEIITYIDGGTTVLPGGGAGGGAGGGGGAAPADGGGAAEIPDEETPLGDQPQELIDLDEEETPLANGGLFSINGNASLLGIPIPVVIVAGAVIAGGLWYMLVYRRKKKQKEIEL